VQQVLDSNDIRYLAKARFKDAQALLRSRRFEGAIYLCGYAVELALKARICHTLKWQGFPSTNSEFKPYQSFKTHDLDVLLHLSGIEAKIKTTLFAEWSAVAQWSPESRYTPSGTVTPSDAIAMLASTKSLLSKI
jgi:hypothetical protein